ncbi:MAG: dUTP diphosphatase [Clostridia bacterium]|nr:dUTP diphosphatase [Clostridia bacterium]
MLNLPLKLLRPGAQAPTRATPGSAGYDIRACMEAPVVIQAKETRLVGAGFAMQLEPGYAAFIYARSGLGIKCGIVPANCVGVVDSDYRGEVMVGLRNHSDAAFVVHPGDRIAQMVIARCELPEIEICDSIQTTQRGAGGFGSSGT